MSCLPSTQSETEQLLVALAAAGFRLVTFRGDDAEAKIRAAALLVDKLSQAGFPLLHGVDEIIQIVAANACTPSEFELFHGSQLPQSSDSLANEEKALAAVESARTVLR